MIKFSKDCFIIIFVLLLAFSISLVADDTRFYADGDTLFPLQENNISMEKEVLKIRKVKGGWDIDVYFEFYNPNGSKELLIGFVTPPPCGADLDASTLPLGYGISNFQVRVNKLPVEYTISTTTSPEMPNSRRYSRWNDGEGDTVFLFKAKFFKGINVITHKYNVAGGDTSPATKWLQYRLTTGKSWAGSKIRHFELYLDSDDDRILHITKFDLGKKMKIMGKVKKFPKESNKFFFRTGYLYVTADNYEPSDDITFEELQINYWLATDSDGPIDYEFFINSKQIKKDFEVFKIATVAYCLKANDIREWNDIKEKIANFSVDSLRILRNLPFAFHGYKFNSSDLYNFYSQFIWYIPDKDIKPVIEILSPKEREYVEYIINLEKSKVVSAE